MYNKYDFIDGCDTGEKIEFKFNNKKYLIDEDNSKYFLYCEDDNKYQYFNSSKEIIESGKIDGKFLKDILDELEIIFIDFNTKKEFIAAAIMNREIEFEYNGVNYFKSSDPNGYYIYNSNDKSRQYFKSNEELLEKAVLEGIPLKELWDKIFIQCLF